MNTKFEIVFEYPQEQGIIQAIDEIVPKMEKLGFKVSAPLTQGSPYIAIFPN